MSACDSNVDVPWPMGSPFTESSYNVLLDGDSRTEGWNCTEEYPYINLLDLGDSVSVAKSSYGGATIKDLNDRPHEFYENYYDPESLTNVLVIWIGANDLNVNNERAGSVYKNLVRYCYKRRSEGWEIIVCTEISINGGVSDSFDAQRLIYNELIYLTWRDFADRIANLGAVKKLGVLGANQDSEYFCDGVHLTNSGTRIVASVIEKSIIAQLKRPNSLSPTDGDY